MSSITNGRELPPGWENPPVYARYSVQLGKMLDERRISGMHLAPYLRNMDVQWEGVNTTDLPEMDFSEEERERYVLQKGDLLVCEGGEVGRTAEWNGELKECFFQKAIHRLRPITQKDEPRFFRYFMRMVTDRGDFTLSTASTIQHLTAEKLRVVRYPAPPRDQQRAIADYLDRETARLDTLLAEKERLLKLLAEKRRALITRAVTRGLGPGSSMRDSGIPWLGEIPAHWNLMPLRFLVNFVGGATPDTGKEKYWSGDIPWVSPKDMKHGEIEGSEDHVTELAVFDTSLRMVPSGSVLVVVRGMILAHSFPAAITKAPVTVNQDMKALLCREILDPWFLRDYFRGVEHYLVTLADSSAHGTRKLETERLGQVPILVPPRAEQKQIARCLSDSTSKIDKTRMATERTIALLKERRAALIAAAVTGQIDVGRAG